MHHEVTLIEYAFFFGSIQIVKYLHLSGVEIDSKSWLFAIHGRNPELIYFLEENNIKAPENDFDICFYESIESHHNEIALYIQTNYLNDQENQRKKLESFGINTYSNCLKCHNYELLPDEFFNSKFVLLYLIKYGYLKLFQLFLKAKNIDLNAKIENEIFFIIILNEIFIIFFNTGINIIFKKDFKYKFQYNFILFFIRLSFFIQ